MTMTKGNPEINKKILNKLTEKGANNPCPICNNKEFILLSEYSNLVLQEKLKNVRLADASIPSIVVVCKNCGYIRQHALSTLGLQLEVEKQEP